MCAGNARDGGQRMKRGIVGRVISGADRGGLNIMTGSHIFKIGQIWINERDFKVKILDFGIDDLWLLYLANNNKVAWKKDRFLELYSLLRDVKGGGN